MLYTSTRNRDLRINSAKAIVSGISKDGGLFVPEKLPYISLANLELLSNMNYIERASFILSKFLTDFTDNDILECVNKAYSKEKFSSDDIAPIVKLDDSKFVLELWHGPTCAFKDMALQLLPHLLTTSMKKEAGLKNVKILVATSGDTGKAALEGFKNVNGTSILVFYPENGVSDMQKLQMVTQDGKNVDVCSIKGNFDDAQSGVKKIFTDKELCDQLNENGVLLSSANSINWGRLVPQIVYYFSAYCDMLKNGHLSDGELVNIVVPTGNFGNILAAYYAKKMGLPVKKFICASNSNNVLTDFINTGRYDKNRKFYSTISPSMDILISSNLERLLFHLYNENDEKICNLYGELVNQGSFEVCEEVKMKLQDEFYGEFCDDIHTKKTIKSVFDKYKYLIDPHTAVAFNVYDKYVMDSKDNTKTIIASTASPYKFVKDVLDSIGEFADGNIFEQLGELSKITRTEIPKPISNLNNKNVRFNKVIFKDEMRSYLLNNTVCETI